MSKSQNLATLHASAASGNAANKPPTHYSLRGTIENLEGQINDIITEITYHRQQLQIVKSESETANQVLNMKIDEMRGRTEFEEHKIQNTMSQENNK